jgi:tetratricopeptide (TPR) repeat protein
MASLTDPTYVFPYRTESLEVLKNVIGEYPNDAIAKMYYGDLLFYLRRHEEAVAVWEEANRLDPENYQVNRNLAIGKYAKSKNYGAAIDLLERAFAQSNKNLRIYNELEQLYVLQKDFDKLEKHYDNNLEILKQKGDFAQNAADFYIQRNRFEDAQKVLATTYFSAAEKALGKPVRHVRYAEAYIGAGEKLLEQKKYKEAIEKLEKAYEYPEYLNEAEVNHPVTTRTDYFLALAYKYNKQKSRANEYFQKAIEQNINPVSVASIYKAKSLHETGKPKEAEKIVTELLQNLLKQNKQESAINDYLKSLAYEFLGEQEKAEKAKLKALDKNYNVVMEAMYESSFIDQKKFALE